MNALIIGVGSIATRRVIPALAALPDIHRISLASLTHADISLVPEANRGQAYSAYEEALRAAPPGLAYISLPNSMHFEWARRALEAGFHVIVDKPVATTLEQVESLAEMAAKEGRCLAESTVWTFHPRFDLARNIVAESNGSITRVSAAFSFPPLAKANFRNDPNLGGGCILDLGPYAASCARFFLGAQPEEIVARILTRDEASGLETSFSILTTYGQGRAFAGHFGFNTEYRNTISAFGPGIAMELERAFTVPADLEPVLQWRAANQSHNKVCPAADSFALFLGAVVRSIRDETFKQFLDPLLEDAHFINRLKRSASPV